MRTRRRHRRSLLGLASVAALLATGCPSSQGSCPNPAGATPDLTAFSPVDPASAGDPQGVPRAPETAEPRGDSFSDFLGLSRQPEDGLDTGGDPGVEPPAGDAQGEVLKEGQASWYGPGFHGRTTANGETYDQNAMTAAMTGVELGIRVRVVREDTGASVEVRVNDRGPYAVDGNGRLARVNGEIQPHPTRVIDLSRAAMESLGGIQAGVIRVKVYKL